MKRITLIVALMVSTVYLCAQEKQELEDKKWNMKGATGINFSQVSFSNWAAGGDNSVAGNAFLNGSLIRKSGNWLWDNSLILEYGLTNTKSQGTQKATDRIELSTQIGYSTGTKWYYTGVADFKTQFGKGYNYPKEDGDRYISKFMAPAYSTVSLGIEYRPNTEYSIYFSPLAAKMTFVQDQFLSDMGAFGVDPGDKFRIEMGALLKAKGEKKIMENIVAKSTLDLFTAYDDSFGNIDVNWDVMISMKVNKFISANLNTSLVYDDDVKSVKDGISGGPKVQFKEMLGVGLSYNF